MKEREYQVQQWRDVADETHPAGPLFSTGIYAEADITMAGMGPTGAYCTDGCTDDRVDPQCIHREYREEVA